ncbi:MAG: HEAT repeat domain-containing protein, partial [Planctomycetota bacterium]
MRRDQTARFLSLAIAFCALGARAQAQIELPDAPIKPETPPESVDLPEKPSGNLAERMTGKSPYQDSAKGEQEAKARGGLDLPPAPGAPQTPVTPAPGAAPAVPGKPESIDASPISDLPPIRKDAADYILVELRRLEDLHHPLVDQAAQSLIGLGEDGLDGARRGLLEDRAPVILAASKVLLSSSNASDRELVRRRLRSKLPASVGGPLVEAFVALDPVGASPVALAGLLDHPLVGVRTAASRNLQGITDPALLPALLEQLKCDRADTRLRALELAARFESANVAESLLARLKDPSAMVAGSAALLLAAREDPAIVGELRKQAFDQTWILRESAYAILSLVEREDARLIACLDERHVPILLEGLSSSDPFVSGTCAAALAGIGFRSTSLGRAEWLDRAVPECLVRCVSGLEFHNDFSSLQRPASRRLTLISGQAFASDGPAWIRWWSQSRATFQARRAVIDARPELAPSMRLAWTSELGTTEAFRILGPTAASEPFDAAKPSRGEVLRITERQARDLYALLDNLKVFSAERLPGVRGSSTLPGRAFDLGLAGQGKSFRFAGSSSDPWFETLGVALHAVRDRNRWQRYPAPKRHARAEELWFEQAAWWDGEHTEHERALRMKVLVLDNLPGSALERRDGGIAELSSIYASPENVEESDFPVLVSLLRDEPFFTPNARTLLDLSLVHLKPGSPQGAEHVEVLLGLAIERFGERAEEALTKIIRTAGPAVVRSGVNDVRALVRAVSVRQLVELGEPDDLAKAFSMLKDGVPAVQVATIEALGKQRVESARVELLLRARLSDDPAIRVAAIGAVANLGGEGALEAMELGLASPAPGIKIAAARGLALIADPSAAPLLVSLLGQDRRSELFEPARQGLIALGDAATSDLLRAANSPQSRSRREAALLLNQRAVPQAVPVLLTLLTENPNDSLVASELAVISCVDLRNTGNPA